MPVDRELAYETLKWIDPKVYRMYLRLRYRGMTAEQVRRERESLYKLQIFMLVNDALDRLEAKGLIEILNDYGNEQILVRNRGISARDKLDSKNMVDSYEGRQKS